MNFFKTFKRRKILLLNIFLLFYILLNLLDGDRGLFSYFDKVKIEKELTLKEAKLTEDLKQIEHKNNLLSENLNFDYLDILIRKKFNFGNKEEVLIKLNE